MASTKDQKTEKRMKMHISLPILQNTNHSFNQEVLTSHIGSSSFFLPVCPSQPILKVSSYQLNSLPFAPITILTLFLLIMSTQCLPTIVTSIISTPSNTFSPADYTITIDRTKIVQTNSATGIVTVRTRTQPYDTVGAVDILFPATYSSKEGGIFVVNNNRQTIISGVNSQSVGIVPTVQSSSSTIKVTLPWMDDGLQTGNIPNNLMKFQLINLFDNPNSAGAPIITANLKASLTSAAIETSSTTIRLTSVLLTQSTLNFLQSITSTLSVVTITIGPITHLLQAGKHTIELTLPQFWRRNALNITGQAVLNRDSRCSMPCSISNRLGLFIISVGAASITQKMVPSADGLGSYNVGEITLLSVLTPPTTEPINKVTFTVYEATTVAQSGQLTIYVTTPSLMAASISTNGALVGSPLTLTLNFQSSSTVMTTDTFSLTLGSSIPLNSIITLSSPILVSYRTSLVVPATILFSDFVLLTSLPTILSATITITNLPAVPSQQPIRANTLTLFRQGYGYNWIPSTSSTLDWYCLRKTLTNVQVVIVGDDIVGVDATWKLTGLQTANAVGFVIGVGTNLNGGATSPSYRPTISSASVEACPLCSVGSISLGTHPLIATSTSLIVFQVKLIGSSLPSLATLLINAKNPLLISGTFITLCSYDALDYAIACKEVQLPTLKLARLPTKLIILQPQSELTLTKNDLSLFINLPQAQYPLTEENKLILGITNGYQTSQLQCQVNFGNGWLACNVIRGITTDGSVIINQLHGQQLNCVVSFDLPTIIVPNFTVKLRGIVNPESTAPQYFYGAVLDSINRPYYALISDPIAPRSRTIKIASAISTSCQVVSSTVVTISFAEQTLSDVKPYTLKGILVELPVPSLTVIDGSVYAQLSSVLLASSSLPVTISSLSIILNIMNPSSLQEVNFPFQLRTPNNLYATHEGVISIRSCTPTKIKLIEFQMNGLLQQQGQTSLTIGISPITGELAMTNAAQPTFTYLTQIQLPFEYGDVSLSSDRTLSPIITAANTLPTLPLRSIRVSMATPASFTLRISGYSNVLASGSPWIISIYRVNPVTLKPYLVASDSSTVRYSLSSLTKCVFPCKLCSPDNTAICLSCYGSSLTPSFLLDSSQSVCVSQCPAKTYAAKQSQQSEWSCVPCLSPCLQCTSLTLCNSCLPNFYILNNGCLTECPSNYYPSTPTQSCLQCVSPCLTCTSATVCKSCVVGYSLFGSSCIRECPFNTISLESPIIGAECKTCSLPCYGCITSLTSCTGCSSSYYLVNNICVLSCPDKLVPHATQPICISCSTNCLTCLAGKPDNCLSCVSPNYLLSSTQRCLTQCPDGYYPDVVHNLCSSCRQECSLCATFNNCIQCNKGFSLVKGADQLGVCSSNCPTGYYSTNKNGNVCELCQLNCAICVTSDSCIVCSTKSFLLATSTNASQCVQTCPSGRYSDYSTQSCNLCQVGCLQCQSTIACLKCSLGLYLYQGSCTDQCPLTTISLTPTNSTNPTNSIATCTFCDSLFPNCSTCTQIVCLTCKLSYSLSESGQCVSMCPTAWIDVSGSCKRCAQGCNSCVGDVTNCQSCVSGRSLLLSQGSSRGSCVTTCPNPLISFQSQCTGCLTPCLTCTVLPWNCNSCNIGQYLHSTQSSSQIRTTCVKTCPLGYYIAGIQCSVCSSGCTRCNQKGCLECSQGYFVIGVPISPTSLPTLSNISPPLQCALTCPLSHRYASQSLCLACPQLCYQCRIDSINSVTCLQCYENYLNMGSYCVITCPQPLIAQRGRCVVNTTITPIPTIVIVPTTNVTYIPPQYSTLSSAPLPITLVMGLLITATLLSLLIVPAPNKSCSLGRVVATSGIAVDVGTWIIWVIGLMSLNLGQMILKTAQSLSSSIFDTNPYTERKQIQFPLDSSLLGASLSETIVIKTTTINYSPSFPQLAFIFLTASRLIAILLNVFVVWLTCRSNKDEQLITNGHPTHTVSPNKQSNIFNDNSINAQPEQRSQIQNEVQQWQPQGRKKQRTVVQTHISYLGSRIQPSMALQSKTIQSIAFQSNSQLNYNKPQRSLSSTLFWMVEIILSMLFGLICHVGIKKTQARKWLKMEDYKPMGLKSSLKHTTNQQPLMLTTQNDPQKLTNNHFNNHSNNHFKTRRLHHRRSSTGLSHDILKPVQDRFLQPQASLEQIMVPQTAQYQSSHSYQGDKPFESLDQTLYKNQVFKKYRYSFVLHLLPRALAVIAGLIILIIGKQKMTNINSIVSSMFPSLVSDSTVSMGTITINMISDNSVNSVIVASQGMLNGSLPYMSLGIDLIVANTILIIIIAWLTFQLNEIQSTISHPAEQSMDWANYVGSAAVTKEVANYDQSSQGNQVLQMVKAEDGTEYIEHVKGHGAKVSVTCDGQVLNQKGSTHQLGLNRQDQSESSDTTTNNPNQIYGINRNHFGTNGKVANEYGVTDEYGESEQLYDQGTQSPRPPEKMFIFIDESNAHEDVISNYQQPSPSHLNPNDSQHHSSQRINATEFLSNKHSKQQNHIEKQASQQHSLKDNQNMPNLSINTPLEAHLEEQDYIPPQFEEAVETDAAEWNYQIGVELTVSHSIKRQNVKRKNQVKVKNRSHFQSSDNSNKQLENDKQSQVGPSMRVSVDSLTHTTKQQVLSEHNFAAPKISVVQQKIIQIPIIHNNKSMSNNFHNEKDQGEVTAMNGRYSKLNAKQGNNNNSLLRSQQHNTFKTTSINIKQSEQPIESQKKEEPSQLVIPGIPNLVESQNHQLVLQSKQNSPKMKQTQSPLKPDSPIKQSNNRSLSRVSSKRSPIQSPNGRENKRSPSINRTNSNDRAIILNKSVNKSVVKEKLANSKQKSVDRSPSKSNFTQQILSVEQKNEISRRNELDSLVQQKQGAMIQDEQLLTDQQRHLQSLGLDPQLIATDPKEQANINESQIFSAFKYDKQVYVSPTVPQSIPITSQRFNSRQSKHLKQYIAQQRARITLDERDQEEEEEQSIQGDSHHRQTANSRQSLAFRIGPRITVDSKEKSLSRRNEVMTAQSHRNQSKNRRRSINQNSNNVSLASINIDSSNGHQHVEHAATIADLPKRGKFMSSRSGSTQKTLLSDSSTMRVTLTPIHLEEQAKQVQRRMIRQIRREEVQKVYRPNKSKG